MTGSSFLANHRGRPFYEWEKAALELAKSGDDVAWPTAPVTISEGGHTIVFRVPIDYFAIGKPNDYVRLPLTPKIAQAIANVKGAVLPTPKLVYETWRQAPVKTRPVAMVPNRGANLEQYAEHSRLIDDQLPVEGIAKLRSGLKKDVVVSSLVKPGKVIIFGWYQPNGPDVFDNRLSMQSPDRQPIQPHSDAHGDFYVDYSHGVRLVEGVALVDGEPMDVAELYKHPVLGKIVSHDGPLRSPRYPSSEAVQPKPPSPPAPVQGKVTLTDLGLSRILEMQGVFA